MEIKNAVNAADNEAQYDRMAKRLLGNKQILAYILIKTVDEFKGMKPRDVVPLIEGDPLIGAVPVEPGMTNAKLQESGDRVIGMDSENEEIREGMVRFDIIFYVRMKDGLSQIIVNVEAQKKDPSEYEILNRAVFYASRMISSQKERDFVKNNYNNIKPVYTIWVCMNMPEISLDYVCLKKESLLGSYNWKGGLHLLNIILIGLTKRMPDQSGELKLHRLLSTLLSHELSAEQKLSIIETEYEIALENNMKEDIKVMCNLSQAIRDEYLAQGIEQGIAGIIFNMHEHGFSMDQISHATNKSIEEVEAVIAGKKPVKAVNTF